VQICVGYSFGVCSGENLAGANLCRVFVWSVVCGKYCGCKFVSGLRLGCVLGRSWQVQICVGSSFGLFCVGNIAGANLCGEVDHFGVTLGQLWVHFGVTLGSLWGHSGVSFGPLWGNFGLSFGSLGNQFGVTFG